MWQLLRETQKNRELIWALALKDLQVRYKRSALGFLWALLNPLFTMIILTVVFSTLMRVAIPYYPIFIISTLLPWTFFAQSLSYAADSIVANGELLKKVYVAKSVFPMAAVLSHFIGPGYIYPYRCSDYSFSLWAAASSFQWQTFSSVTWLTSFRLFSRRGSIYRRL